jgi:hypothetical protein
MNICVSVSIGELLDKLSILELKKNIIKDTKKTLEIEKEIDGLIQFENIKNENLFYYNILKWINEQIWIFTDIIKGMSQSKIQKDFDLYKFLEIFLYNDRR